MNPLNDYPAIRKTLYKVQWILAGVSTLLGAYFTLSGYDVADLPSWYVIGIGLLPVLWTYLGITADKNVDLDTAPIAGASLDGPSIGASGSLYKQSDPVETGRQIQKALDAYHRSVGK